MAGYGSDEGFTAWLADHGYEEPANYVTLAALRQRGSSYIDGLYGSRFPGVPTGGYAQERAYPRTGATVYGQALADDVIPAAIVNASYFAAYQEGLEPGSLSVVAVAAGAIKREKTGPLETEYFEGKEGAVANATPILSAIEGLLAPFLVPVMPDVMLGIWSIGC